MGNVGQSARQARWPLGSSTNTERKGERLVKNDDSAKRDEIGRPKPPDLGFKALSAKNWLEPDIPFYTNELKQDEWISLVLRTELKATVPNNVLALFECARAMLAYGWLFYPLCTLAAEQSQRVMEAAARTRCDQLGLPSSYTDHKGKRQEFNFATNIDRLASRKAISKADAKRWQSARKLRNYGSHPSFQALITPTMALASFEAASEYLNRLFAQAHP